ncbi:hypothetical protein JW877_05360 [bacterium]|nr:hypothetical protein [bacterium]
MLVWAFILVLINYLLLVSYFFEIPSSMHWMLPLIAMLMALGILYRILYKTREGEKEKLRQRVAELESIINKEQSDQMPSSPEKKNPFPDGEETDELPPEEKR